VIVRGFLTTDGQWLRVSNPVVIRFFSRTRCPVILCALDCEIQGDQQFLDPGRTTDEGQRRAGQASGPATVKETAGRMSGYTARTG